MMTVDVTIITQNPDTPGEVKKEEGRGAVFALVKDEGITTGVSGRLSISNIIQAVGVINTHMVEVLNEEVEKGTLDREQVDILMDILKISFMTEDKK